MNTHGAGVRTGAATALTTSQRGSARRTIIVRVASSAVLLGAALLIDRWAYATFNMPHIYDVDAGRMFRTFGFLPFWWIGALALWLGDDAARNSIASDTPPAPGPARHVRALLLAGATTLSGIAGEIVKLLIRRERPDAGAGSYVFRSWSERTFSTAGLAMPSSHAIIAFGAAFALARMFPRARWLWYALAAGCALTRVLARAHFVSDVVLSGIVAWLAVELLFSRVPVQAGGRI
jgi:membrane-associated phospholipid phosphatase